LNFGPEIGSALKGSLDGERANEMYICNCNGITEDEVAKAIASGASHWEEVHAYYNCEPCCGMCECEISDALGSTDEAGSKGSKCSSEQSAAKLCPGNASLNSQTKPSQTIGPA
tara:strand:- start:283 stop:624 length:342 start_codon:yes stop_codon:yes gene_type:complete